MKRKESDILEKLHLPKDITRGAFILTAIGNKEMYIENYKGILEYSEEIIRLANDICIYGQNLSVEEITSEDILIIGKINNIEFE